MSATVKATMQSGESNIIIYNTLDGRASVALYAHDGSVWMNQAQLAELFIFAVIVTVFPGSTFVGEADIDALAAYTSFCNKNIN